jgi:hypothetical protein
MRHRVGSDHDGALEVVDEYGRPASPADGVRPPILASLQRISGSPPPARLPCSASLLSPSLMLSSELHLRLPPDLSPPRRLCLFSVGFPPLRGPQRTLTSLFRAHAGRTGFPSGLVRLETGPWSFYSPARDKRRQRRRSGFQADWSGWKPDLHCGPPRFRRNVKTPGSGWEPDLPRANPTL